jgi:hypothetical protein
MIATLPEPLPPARYGFGRYEQKMSGYRAEVVKEGIRGLGERG